MRTPLLAAALLLALTGCNAAPKSPATAPTPSAPAESAFTDGTCRLAAPDIIAIGRDARRLGDGGKVEEDVKDSLRESQDRLAALAETATPDAKPVLDRLVLVTGLVRVRADGNTYETQLGDNLVAAYDAAVLTCTGGSTTPTPS